MGCGTVFKSYQNNKGLQIPGTPELQGLTLEGGAATDDEDVEPEGASSSSSSDDDDVEADTQDEVHSDARWEIAKAWGLLAAGTLIVSIFSDPMVDVLGNFGRVINVNPFYVSFIVTPLASNAAEVITGLKNAAKGTNESMANCCNNLFGAATMNCTFCLSIFLGLVYFRELEWNFSAEVIAILLTIWVVGYVGLQRTFYMKDMLIIGSMFPLSVALIYVLENVFGLA